MIHSLKVIRLPVLIPIQGDVQVATKQECRGRPPEAFARGDIQTTNELRSGFAQVV